MVNKWTFTAKDISKKPNLLREFGKKYILLTDRGSFPFNKREEAIRYVKRTPEYRSRVHKPIIKIEFIK